MSTFIKEIEEVINRHSKEKDSDTPDFILAGYLHNCLQAFEIAINKREEWYGRKKEDHVVTLKSSG
jgi:hypothetical protein